MKKTAIYIRVSTDKQAQEGDSIPAQRDALRKYIDSHDDMVFCGEYLDDGISGTKSDRDELQRMLSDVKDGMIDQILVTKLDRLYRNIRHYLNMQELLDKHHVNWLAIWEPIYDTSTPQGRLIINQMMSIAQFEAENTGQRIRQVQAYKISKGEVISGSTPPGYSIEDKRLVKNKDAETVRQMFEYFSFCGNISQTMGEFNHYGIFPQSKAAFKHLLMNTKYAGFFRDNPHFCDPIIDRELFDDVQRKLKINIKCSQKRIYLFTGLIKCPECGRVMSSLHRSKKNRYSVSQNMYRCKRHYGSKVKLCGYTKIVNEKKLEEYLLRNVQDLMEEYVISVDAKSAPKKDNSIRIAYLQKRMSKLKELYVNDLLTLDEYKHDKEEIQNELENLQVAEQVPDTAPYRQFVAADIEEIYSDLSVEEKRTFWRSIIKEIHLDENKNYKVIFL